MSIIKRGVVAGALGIALLTVAGPASAHTHQVCTPGAGDPIIQPEPFHDGLPGSSDARQDLDTNPNYGLRGFHPIHESLHLSQGAEERAITVVVLGTGCP